MKSEFVMVDLASFASPLSDFSEINPKDLDLLAGEWSKRTINPGEGFNNRFSDRSEFGNIAVFRVAVPYQETRFNHPILKFFESLNVLRHLFIFWFHFSIRGGFGSQSSKAATSSKLQTWSEIPASIAGVTRKD